MTSLDEFWKKRYENDPEGYQEHLERRAKWREEFEEKDRNERKILSQLFLEPTRDAMKDFIEGLPEKQLLNMYYHLERAKNATEERYHDVMEQEVFSASTTTFKEVVNRNKWEQVKEALLQLFPDQEKSIQGYERVYEELKTLDPVKGEENYVIVMRLVEEEDEESYYDIIGRKKGDLQSYALDFTPWPEWLGFFCDERSLQTQGDLSFICHCLWEMTFDGFDQEQIQENFQEIKRRAEEVEQRDRD